MHFNISLASALFICITLVAQSTNYKNQLQTVAKQEGEIFIALEYMHPERNKPCRMEDLFTNTIAFNRDTLVVDFDNYTESFCEAINLETQLTYHIKLRDIDPSKIILMQRKYNLKNNKLLEGPLSWYELQINTKGQLPVVKEQSHKESQLRRINQFRIIFKTQEGAKKALAALKELTKTSS
ncbi:hypothetical protein QNI19_34890 [Cytophagaceae bacterium DM2B3-1]|uniref:Uncharacterized protein n=1 Tax=Xanthocytophaga flava TaxID=3048013 RepID=A0ABT7CWR2_9BACT|nr:hypothetical protein [Xanthocytophaga flavus]MDJ1498182.1 hypothetical protein [Xanthocytophaga flavus]